MSIELQNVSFTYAKGTPFAHLGLKDFSLRIGNGEWITVMGPTGSGKSTFLQHLNGLLRPDSGAVLLDNINIHSTPASLAKARQEIGLVFQYPEHQLFCGTVFEEIAYGPQNMGLGGSSITEKVKAALETVGLDYNRYRDRSPFELSGGEMRRVALAGVLAQAPRYIALDEPTAGLDWAGKQRLIETIKKLNREYGITVIWVTHEITEVALAAGRMLVINGGQLILDGEIRDTLHNPILDELGLDVPVPVQVAAGLQNRNVRVPGRPITVDEIRQEIIKLMR